MSSRAEQVVEQPREAKKKYPKRGFAGLLIMPARWMERGMALGARHPNKSIFFVGLLAFSIAAALSVRDWPVPFVHDEFAYLLGADTFAHGRLTNPTHPHYEHFETFHVIHKPTYQSKYPPASSMAMAFGQVFFGHPIVGVWLTTALAVAAVCWMLMAWVPPRWAIYGGFIAALHPGIVVTWSQSYWGGSVALLGGALVFGGVRRLVDRWSSADAIVLGIGLGILAHSRPYEGLLLFIPVGVLIAWMAYRQIASGFFVRLIRPMALLFLMGVLAVFSVLYYNWVVTGDYLSFPHRVWSQTYLGEFAHPENDRIARYTGSNPGTFVSRSERLVWFYLGAWLALPFLVQRWRFDTPVLRLVLYLGIAALLIGWLLPFIGVRLMTVIAGLLGLLVIQTFWNNRQPWALYSLATVLGIAIISVVNTRAWPHYLASLTPLLLVLLLGAIRAVRMQRIKGLPWGRPLVSVLPLVLLLLAGFSVWEQPKTIPAGWDRPGVWVTPGWALARSDMEKSFSEDPYSHLFFVRYPDWYSFHTEWVYNASDIDGAKVVWAHDLGEEKNRALMDYYRDRRAWLIEPGAQPIRISPYSEIGSSSDAAEVPE